MEKNTAVKEKVCLEEDCIDPWEELGAEARRQAGQFVYCPFCANEMITRCSACGEAIHDTGFRFCPWCGVEFEN